jgi:GTP cyclohydrolase II
MQGELVLAITAHRAATLKVAAYDGDLARVAVPGDVSLDWLRLWPTRRTTCARR